MCGPALIFPLLLGGSILTGLNVVDGGRLGGDDDEGGRQQIETDEGERDANCKGDGDDGSRDGDSRGEGGRRGHKGELPYHLH